MISGSQVLLERALDNLLSNAAKYGGGQPIDVEVAAADHHAIISVRDHGAGVAAEEVARLGSPFFRGRNASGNEGQGLGLSAVMRIVSAHGGECRVLNATGGGFQVILRVPRAQPQVGAQMEAA
jgi:two-component system sensor histidine kinase TctE